MNVKALTAEFIGTAALIFIGAGAGALGVGGLVGVALAHGLVILTFAYIYGPISGGHFNPAVTVGLWAGKQVDTITALSYIVTQLVAGIVGALLLAFVVSGVPSAAGLGATVLAPGVSPIQGLVLETILTFFLVNAVYFAAVKGNAGSAAPIAIGLTLALAILMGGPLTGGSLNPARTLGPAVASGNFADIWLYFVGQVLGGLLAAGLFMFLGKDK